MIDANQVWDVARAIEWTSALARFDILWIEQPTSPDDVLATQPSDAASHPWGWPPVSTASTA